MKAPLISVMIGAYNAEGYLVEAIESVFAQTYRHLELIVVDDGSTDSTADVARSFGDRLIFVPQANAGNGAARNRALQEASGDAFAFLDADDRFTPEKLDLQVTELDHVPDVDMVFGYVREFVSPELTEAERARVRAPASQAMPWTAPNLMLIRRPSFERVGRFEETVKVGVTVDWYARALEQALRGAMIPHVVLERRLHLSNNGIRERASRHQYLHVIKQSLDRRREQASRVGEPPAPPAV